MSLLYTVHLASGHTERQLCTTFFYCWENKADNLIFQGKSKLIRCEVIKNHSSINSAIVIMSSHSQTGLALHGKVGNCNYYWSISGNLVLYQSVIAVLQTVSFNIWDDQESEIMAFCNKSLYHYTAIMSLHCRFLILVWEKFLHFYVLLL